MALTVDSWVGTLSFPVAELPYTTVAIRRSLFGGSQGKTDGIQNALALSFYPPTLADSDQESGSQQCTGMSIVVC